MVQKKPRKQRRTAAERNREAVRQALAQGFEPLTQENLDALAVGTPEEAQDLLDVSAELRRRSRARRRSS